MYKAIVRFEDGSEQPIVTAPWKVEAAGFPHTAEGVKAYHEATGGLHTRHLEHGALMSSATYDSLLEPVTVVSVEAFDL